MVEMRGKERYIRKKWFIEKGIETEVSKRNQKSIERRE